MKVKIEIECETAGELTSNLHTIIEDIQAQSKQNPAHEFEEGLHPYSYSNCMGTYTVEIIPDNESETIPGPPLTNEDKAQIVDAFYSEVDQIDTEKTDYVTKYAALYDFYISKGRTHEVVFGLADEHK
jgi:hypothetical protein